MRGSSLQKREGALTAAGRFAFFSSWIEGPLDRIAYRAGLFGRATRLPGPPRWRRLQFVFIAMAVGGTGLFPVPADSAGPAAVTVTATGTITNAISITAGNLIGRAYTVYISFQASVLNNTCAPGSTYCAITSSGTTITLDVAGEPAVSFSGNISGNYTISPFYPPAELLSVSAGLDDTFNGKITFGTNTTLFNASNTFY
jgi:hypothetical protein